MRKSSRKAMFRNGWKADRATIPFSREQPFDNGVASRPHEHRLSSAKGAGYANRGNALFDARRYAEAIAFAQETERRSPDLFDDPGLLGFCFLMLGKLSEASHHLSQLPAEQWKRLKGEAVVIGRAGNRAGAERKLQQMQQLFGDSASYEYAGIYAQLGEKDRAFAALDRGWAIRDPGLIRVRIDPFIDPLRGDPRLDSIIKRMQFRAAG